MNSMPTANRFHCLVATSLFSVLSLNLGAALPAAADGFDAVTAIVKYRDLDVSRSPGAAALYGRIHAAAQKVCLPFEGRGVSDKTHMTACVKKAIADAVTTVNEPTLFAIYSAKTGTILSTRLASRQNR